MSQIAVQRPLHNPELGAAPETTTSPQVQRPAWLPSYIPELQGLRGIAVLGVVIYHNHPLLTGTPFYYASLWGWAGVNLFFVLSGFLITSILIEARDKPHYFRNFYARRALRIWPVYILLLILCYSIPDWFLGDKLANQTHWKTLVAYALFLQNLRHTPLPGTLGPTWSLAIEEQYYFLWAPIVRISKGRIGRWLLPILLLSLVVISPLIRFSHAHWLNPTHTLIHLDGIAMGSLLALGIYSLRFTRRTWLWIGVIASVAGIALAATYAGGTSFLDSALALAFTGVVLLAIGGTGARNPLALVFRRGPLAYYGQISYGMYMTHILVFVYFGSFDARLDHMGITGNLIILGLRIVVATVAATILWYGFESRILKLKRYFMTK
ncbi:acyltransferase family protein [Acidicapsa dinghuensis]|uniref:Acyltransferase family protein n=1 Tax=Acidicapsa dinghuensis TaxID=2218256 RepID=A0ABW1EDV7_9BACT|nr:acyltransferase [Acidicapsa dinghuensis]